MPRPPRPFGGVAKGDVSRNLFGTGTYTQIYCRTKNTVHV